MYKNLIFDLDGTLLDTLPDIRYAINLALEECGYDYSFSLADTHYLIGNGADTLVKRALKENSEDMEAFSALKKVYMRNYAEYQNVHTKPFNGLVPVLEFLKERGINLFVVTNKPDALAHVVVKAHFGKLFTSVMGHSEGNPVKPDPYLLNLLFSEFDLKKEDCLFIGDSEVDVDTAKNGGLKCGLVTWGYGYYKPSLLDRADYVIKRPKELAQAALGKDGW